MLEDEDSLTNNQLRQSPAVQACLQKLAGLTRSDFPALVNIYSQLDGQRIPLFEDENGDEYQIRLDIDSSLPVIKCPSNSIDLPIFPKPTCPLYQLRSLISRPVLPDPRTIPSYVVRLGRLEIRTDSRSPECFNEPGTITEGTDYEIMIDAESEDMPVWLFVSQPQLEDRLQPFVYCDPISILPVFQGLLLDGNSFFYDSASILPSIRDLENISSTKETFKNVCKLIQETRSIKFPSVIRQSDNQLEHFIRRVTP